MSKPAATALNRSELEGRRFPDEMPGRPMNNMMTQYELLYIIPATLTDEDVSGVEATVKALLEKYGATIEDVTRVGKFRFAYPIKNVRHGHYVLVHFTSEGSAIAAITEALRISNDVLRSILLRADEAGGDKFDMIQYVEVNLDNKESGDRRRRDEKPKVSEEIKSAAAVLDGETKEEVKPEAAATELSATDLEKKIDAALVDKA